jgi:hypothetical protein
VSIRPSNPMLPEQEFEGESQTHATDRLFPSSRTGTETVGTRARAACARLLKCQRKCAWGASLSGRNS